MEQRLDGLAASPLARGAERNAETHWPTGPKPLILLAVC